MDHKQIIYTALTGVFRGIFQLRCCVKTIQEFQGSLKEVIYIKDYRHFKKYSAPRNQILFMFHFVLPYLFLIPVTVHATSDTNTKDVRKI